MYWEGSHRVTGLTILQLDPDTGELVGGTPVAGDAYVEMTRYDAVADGGAARRGAVSSLKLYNLASDIHEDKDLAAAMPDKAKELQAKWDVWNKSNIKPLWGNGAGDNDGPEPGASPRNNRPARKANANAANGKNL